MCIEHTKQCVYGYANMCEHVQLIVSCWDAVCVSAVFMYTCVSRHVHGCSMSYEKHVSTASAQSLLFSYINWCIAVTLTWLHWNSATSSARGGQFQQPHVLPCSRLSLAPTLCLGVSGMRSSHSHPCRACFLWHLGHPLQTHEGGGEGKRGKERNKDGPRPHPVSGLKCSSICDQKIWTHTDWMEQITNESHMAAHMVLLRTGPGGR